MKENQTLEAKKEKAVSIISFVGMALLYGAASFTAWALLQVATTYIMSFSTVLLPLAIDLLLCFKTKTKSYILMLAPIVPLVLSIAFLIAYNGHTAVFSMMLFDLLFLGVRIFCQILFLVKDKKIKLIPVCLVVTVLLAATTIYANNKQPEIKELLMHENEATVNVGEDKRLKLYIRDLIDGFMKKFNKTNEIS